MKVKMPILAQVAFLFLVAGVVAFVSLYHITYEIKLERAVVRADEVAGAVANSVLAALDSEADLERLYVDEGFRDDVYQAFRFVCRKTDIRYLYLYTVGEDGFRHYIVCAANSDEDDARMQREYGFGSVRKLPLFQSEVNVLNGTADEDHELIDNDYGYVCAHTVALRDGDGKILALVGADYNMENIEEMAMNSVLNSGLLLVMTHAVAYVVALVLIWWSMLRPIRRLSERMRAFAMDGKEIGASTSGRAPYENEVTDIEDAFGKMTTDIRQYVHDNEILTRREAYTSAELDVARNIQKGIVPERYAIDDDHLGLFGFAEPAREVGGDFYDVFALEDGRMCVVIGDISGKGVSAALFMVMVKTTIRENLLSGRGLAETLNRVNRELWRSNPELMFATVFAMALDVESGILAFANAGHEVPLVLGRDPYFREVRSGTPLGLFEDAGITDEKLVLRDGEGVFLYTDGITEAVNAGRELYGRDRLRETVRREYREDIRSYSPQALVDAVTSSVLAHTGDMDQTDDITCLALVYRGGEAVEEALDPRLESFAVVREAILRDLGDGDRARDVILACEEIFCNIVDYSGADEVVFSARLLGDDYLVTYVDDGVAFDPVEAAVRERAFEELAFGGMGIMIARTYAKDMAYSRTDGRNVLLLVFDATWRRGAGEPGPRTSRREAERHPMRPQLPRHEDSGDAWGRIEAREPAMRTTRGVDGGERTIRVEGWVDTRAGRALLEELDRLDDGVEGLTMDLSGLEYLSSTGLRAMVVAYERVGGALVIRGASPRVRDIFRTAGLDKAFRIE